MSEIQQLIDAHATSKVQKRIAEVKKFAIAMVSGTDQAEYIEKYRKRESASQKQQRNRLYNSPTKAVLGRLRTYFKKLARLKTVNVIFEGQPDIREQVLNYGRDKLIEVIGEHLEKSNTYDPNAYTIYSRIDEKDEAGNVEATKLNIIKVPSERVIYAQENTKGDVTRFIHSVHRESETGPVTDYHEYKLEGGECVAYVYMARPKEAEQVEEAFSTINQVGYDKVRYELGVPFLPISCDGAYEDEQTGGVTKGTWFQRAEEALKDLIRNKNFQDVTLVLHVFQRRWEYVKPCTHKDEEGRACKRGFLDGIESKRCPACSGTGLSALFTTDQEVLRLEMPQVRDAMLDLNKLAHSEALDIQLPELLEKMIDAAEVKIANAVFSTGLVERATGAATATEANYAYEDIYDTLLPLARKIEEHAELAIKAHCGYLNKLPTKVGVRFPTDFKMKSLQTLIAEYKAAKDASLSTDVQYVLLEQIISKLAEDNEAETARIMARHEWAPFSNLAAEQISAALIHRKPDDDDRILFTAFNRIFNFIEEEHKEFYSYTLARQAEVIKEQIEKERQRIKFADDSQAGLKL